MAHLPDLQTENSWLDCRFYLPLKTVLVLLLLLLCPGMLGAAGVVLVANSNIPVDELSRSEIKNIFLARVRTIQGVRVHPVMLKDQDITRHFLRSEVGKTPAQFSSYYKKMIFTGRGRPLPRIDSEEAVLAHVSTTSGALGYVSMDAVTDAVKIVRIED